MLLVVIRVGNFCPLPMAAYIIWNSPPSWFSTYAAVSRSSISSVNPISASEACMICAACCWGAEALFTLIVAVSSAGDRPEPCRSSSALAMSYSSEAARSSS